MSLDPVIANYIGTPPAELDVTKDLVQRLLAAQFPELAVLPLEFVDSGWDNVMFRLGDELAVRLPRRALGEELIVKEQAWLPKLASRFQVPIPVPEYLGVPGEGYPWHWSVVPWIDGRPEDLNPPNTAQGKVLATFLTAMHQAAPADAPHNPYRGVPLVKLQEGIEVRLARLRQETDLITGSITALWEQALSVEIDMPKTWLHGDLHQRNVLVDTAGYITGIIDWGDLCAGDRASDLASVWTLLPDADARADVMEGYEATPATWQRAAGWAVMYGVFLSDAGRVDSPHQADMGRDILERLAEDMA